MPPFLAPPIWPDPQPRSGGFAATVVRNTPELVEDAEAQAIAAKCSVAMVGIPDDMGVMLNHGREGARAGPAAFRAALARYGVASPADESADALAFPRVFDAGDVIPSDDLRETHDRITEVVLSLLERGFFPIAIGGGHDLTFPFVRGVAKVYGVLRGLYLDAHLDVRPEVGSGMPFRALMEGGYATDLRVVGMNPLVNSREHFEYFQSCCGQSLAFPMLLEQALPIGQSAFVSLDMDVFDAAHAPGVSALNPSGLTARELEPIIRAAGRSPTVRCFDIMELNPACDVDGRTARLAAHMFLTFLRGFAERPIEPASCGTRR